MKQGTLAFETLVAESGGRLLYTGKDLEDTFRRLGEEFMAQYHLGYDIDPSLKKGKRRRVRVVTADPELKIKSRTGYFTPRSRLETWLKDLRDGEARMRAEAAYELGCFRDRRAIPEMIPLLRDDSPVVRVAALRSLVKLAGDAAYPFIEELLKHEPNPEVREVAREALPAR